MAHPAFPRRDCSKGKHGEHQAWSELKPSVRADRRKGSERVTPHRHLRFAALDYGRKVFVLSDPVCPTDDVEGDIARMRAWFTQFPGKYPDQF